MEMTETTGDKRQKIYEIGYLLLPTIAEEHVAAEVEAIKSIIEKREGAFIAEDFPKLRQLAYTMTKPVTGKNLKFDKAYFGWVKFETSTSAISAIKTELEKISNILRFLVITTVRENTMSKERVVFRPASVENPDAPKKPEEAEKMSEEEIEKTIENLVVE